jgi:hypothetical protein
MFSISELDAGPVIQEDKTNGPGLSKFVDVLAELRGGQNNGPLGGDYSVE